MDGGSGGSGGPAPFLVKTYEMVDDPATDKIVSWSSTMKSFVVWDSNEFSARLLPMYFKHNNFSSFIRQLNTYGFHKIDPERWEFANDDFVKGQKHLLKNIYRRKPIHSHSNPPAGGNADPERIALEGEIDRLSREKNTLQSTLWKFKQQQSGRFAQLEDVEQRLSNMEQRQLKMLAFLQQAAQNPCFVDNLVKMAADSPVDLSTVHKRRRLPQGLISSHDSSENSLYENNSSISKPELGPALDQEFGDRLKLGLCSSIPDGNLITASTQCSNEVAGSSQGKQNEFRGISECIPLGLQALELSDTGASMCPTKNLLFPMAFDEEECHLRLTLASSTSDIVRSNQPDKTPNSRDEEATIHTQPSLDVAPKETGFPVKNKSATADHAEKAPAITKEVPAVPTARANDVFWEQFLTERPGSSDNEEASSGFRANSSDE